jgi:SAM-dependent methyltransferase
VTDFRRDLFQGTAEYYDRFRVPYPPDLISDLSEQASVTGSGTLLDLACGTGHLAFALHERFAQTWAVDQEPDMIDVVKAKAAGLAGFRALIASAENLDAPEAEFDLVTIGNAFHRLRRDEVAGRVLRWLRPGGHLALAWGGSPWDGPEPWQLALDAVLLRWRPPDRIPAGYDRERAERPDATVLTEAGFAYKGERRFTIAHEWTTQSLIGHAYSTSLLSRAALGDAAADFAADLRGSVLASAPPDGRLVQTLSFAYELARRP